MGEAAAAVTVGWAGAGPGAQEVTINNASSPNAAMQQFFIGISLAGWGWDLRTDSGRRNLPGNHRGVPAFFPLGLGA